jgi:pimeloyl-ACP methyl ester carboxylesterase
MANRSSSPTARSSRKPRSNRTDLTFPSGGGSCAATLLMPGRANPPVIIMAHGLGAERAFGLLPYAERFAAAGFAVFMFDYRNFGDSPGEPRNLINPWRHVRDYLSAIACVRSLDGVDTSRIALWGTSFSGGHALAAAARDGHIAAVISQIPFVDGIATMRIFSLSFIANGMLHGLRDLARILTRRRPHTVPIVGTPDGFALMNTPESYAGYLALSPGDTGWKNEAPARIMLRIPFYRPARRARNLRCPVFILCAKNDSLIPADAVRTAARGIPHAELVELDCGHFDVYRGRLFVKTLRMEIDFFKRHLGA